jgi:hypothetical protein
VRRLELAEFCLTVEAVNIDSKQPGSLAGGDGDVEIRVSLPPSRYLSRVGCRVQKTVQARRLLRLRLARKDAQAAICKRKRGF